MPATRTTLGISPGTRTMGFAVIRDGELIEWRVKTFKGLWSEEKLANILGIVEGMLGYYNISSVAVKKVDSLKSSKPLNILMDRIILCVRGADNRMGTYSVHDLNAATGRKQRHLHNSIAEHVLETYPVLREEYIRERNNRRGYYAKMFEAVLCARLLHEQEKLTR